MSNSLWPYLRDLWQFGLMLNAAGGVVLVTTSIVIGILYLLER